MPNFFNKDKKGKKKEEVEEEVAANTTAEEEAPKISMTKGGQEDAPAQEKKPGANAKQFTGPQAELMKKI